MTETGCGVGRNCASGTGATGTDGPDVHAGIVGDGMQCRGCTRHTSAWQDVFGVLSTGSTCKPSCLIENALMVPSIDSVHWGDPRVWNKCNTLSCKDKLVGAHCQYEET